MCAGNITQPYTAFTNGDDFGVGLLHVHNATHIDWRWHRSSDRQLLDSITIAKEQRWSALQQQRVAEAEMELGVKVASE